MQIISFMYLSPENIQNEKFCPRRDGRGNFLLPDPPLHRKERVHSFFLPPHLKNLLTALHARLCLESHHLILWPDQRLHLLSQSSVHTLPGTTLHCSESTLPHNQHVLPVSFVRVCGCVGVGVSPCTCVVSYKTLPTATKYSPSPTRWLTESQLPSWSNS